MKTAVAAPAPDPRQEIADLLGAWLDFRVAWELRKESARVRMRHFTQLIAERRCVVCEEPVESYDEVGRCVYADPCGHRQYQGRAPG